MAKKDEDKDITASTPPVSAATSTVRGQIVRHGGSYVDVRIDKEIRRVVDEGLAKKKLNEHISVPQSLWNESDYPPYARTSKP